MMTGQEVPPPNRVFTILREIHVRHERLKRYVHDGFRFPLPTWGRYMMGFVYFTIPVVGGWHIMQWAISKAHKSIGENGELLENKKVLGIGDQHDGKHIGAGGWGGGVHLAISDEETQRKNRKKLNKFLKSLHVQETNSTTTKNKAIANDESNNN